MSAQLQLHGPYSERDEISLRNFLTAREQRETGHEISWPSTALGWCRYFAVLDARNGTFPGDPLSHENRCAVHPLPEARNLHTRPRAVAVDVESAEPTDFGSCGHEIPSGDLSFALWRGDDGKRLPGLFALCAPCSVSREREAIFFSDEIHAYAPDTVPVLNRGPSHVSHIGNFLGDSLARVTGHTVSGSGFYGVEIHHWWATTPDGREWYGRNGGPGMFLRMRALAGSRRADLHEIPEQKTTSKRTRKPRASMKAIDTLASEINNARGIASGEIGSLRVDADENSGYLRVYVREVINSGGGCSTLHTDEIPGAFAYVSALAAREVRS